jgi:hypothetical protein
MLEAILAAGIMIAIAVAVSSNLVDVRTYASKISDVSFRTNEAANVITTIRAIDNGLLVQTVLPTAIDKMGKRSTFGLSPDDMLLPKYSSMFDPGGLCVRTNVDRNCLRNAVDMISTTGGNFNDFVRLRITSQTGKVVVPDDFRYQVFTAQNIESSMTWALNLYNNIGGANICENPLVLTADQFKKIHPNPDFVIPQVDGVNSFDVVDICICPSTQAGYQDGCPKKAGAPPIVNAPAKVTIMEGDSVSLKFGLRTYKTGVTDHDANGATPAVNPMSVSEASGSLVYPNIGGGNRDKDRPFLKVSPTAMGCGFDAAFRNRIGPDGTALPASLCRPGGGTVLTFFGVTFDGPNVCGNLGGHNVCLCEYCSTAEVDLRPDRIRKLQLPGIFLEFNEVKTANLVARNAMIAYPVANGGNRIVISGKRNDADLPANNQVIRIPVQVEKPESMRVCFEILTCKPASPGGPAETPPNCTGTAPLNADGTIPVECADRLIVIVQPSEPGVISLCRLINFEEAPGYVLPSGRLTIDPDGDPAVVPLRGNLDGYRYCGLSALGPAKLDIIDRSGGNFVYQDIATTKAADIWNKDIEWFWDLNALPFQASSAVNTLKGTLTFAVQPVDTAGLAARGAERTPQRKISGATEQITKEGEPQSPDDPLDPAYDGRGRLLNHYLVKLIFGASNCANPQNFCPALTCDDAAGRPCNSVDQFGIRCPGTRNDCSGWPADDLVARGSFSGAGCMGYNGYPASDCCACQDACQAFPAGRFVSSDPSCRPPVCTDPCPLSYTNAYCPSENRIRNCPTDGADYNCQGTKPPDCGDPSTVCLGVALPNDSCGRSCGTGTKADCGGGGGGGGCPIDCGDGLCNGGAGEDYCTCPNDCTTMPSGCADSGVKGAEQMNVLVDTRTPSCGVGCGMVGTLGRYPDPGYTRCCCDNSAYLTKGTDFDPGNPVVAETGINGGWCGRPDRWGSGDPAICNEDAYPDWIQYNTVVHFCTPPTACIGSGTGAGTGGTSGGTTGGTTGGTSGGTSGSGGCNPVDCSTCRLYDDGVPFESPSCPGAMCRGCKTRVCTCPAANTQPYGQPFYDNCGNSCGNGTMPTCTDACQTDADCPGMPDYLCGCGNCNISVSYCQIGNKNLNKCNTCGSYYCSCSGMGCNNGNCDPYYDPYGCYMP